MRAEDLDPTFRDLVGRFIAQRYRIGSPIATGGMATVFAAHQVGLDREVALKVLCPMLARADDYTARFEREAHSLARLDHPNCLRVLDYGVTEGGFHFLATELIEGEELGTAMAEGISRPRAVDWMCQILAGLQHAHARGVIHRDLKPENLLLVRGRDGAETIKIVDFGIAKLLSAPLGSCSTEAGVVFGTPRYMSPEQAGGLPVDRRSDLYACGILLYRMLAGHLPFDGEDVLDLVRAQIHAEPPPLPVGVPDDLAAIVRRLLSKRPDDRFDTAADTIEALRTAALHEAPPVLTTSSSTDSADRSTWWKQLGLTAAATVVATLAIGAALRPSPSAELGSGRSVAVLTLEDAQRALEADDADRAHEIATVLLDEDPEEPRSLWLDGRALAASGDSARALERYVQARVSAPGLGDDELFRSELDALLREPDVESQAIDAAIQRLDGLGEPFLLELANRTARPLDFVPRHRVLATLRETDAWSEVEVRENARIDLVQAATAPDPCRAYEHGLDVLADASTPSDRDAIRRVRVPSAAGSRCRAAEAKRESLLVAQDFIDTFVPAT